MFNLITRNPYNGFFNDFITTQARGNRDGYDVQANSSVTETDTGYTVTVEMPGLSRSDIEVSIENDTLAVAATRETSRGKVNYSRSWTLSDTVKQEDITARYDAGLLNIDVPVTKSKKRLIAVE